MVAILMLGLVALAAWPAAAQEDGPESNPYFDCPYINYFDTDCPQLQGQEPPVPPTATDEGAEPGRNEVLPDGQGMSLPPGDVPLSLDDYKKLFPLFPKSTLAPDTPPVYRLLLAEPTIETARFYVLWHAARMQRYREAQVLIEQAGRELGDAANAGSLP